MSQEALMKECVKGCAEGVIIEVNVTPNSSLNMILGVDQWRKRLRIKVTAKPERGAANQEILEMFRDIFGVSNADVAITSGHTTSLKTLIVTGMTVERAIPALMAAIDNED